MTFISYVFLALFPLVVVLNTVSVGRGRKWMLLAASYILYGWWDWRFLGLILLSPAVDFVCGVYLDRTTGTERRSRNRRLVPALSVALSLGLLGFFKYFGFFVGSAEQLIGSLGSPWGLETLQIVLSVGISFYTFQTMSYAIDVYRGKMKATRRLDDFMLFVVFFPQLVAGPIERASHLLPQIEKARKATAEEFSSGLELMVVGAFFKMVVGDNMAPYVNTVFHESAPGGAAIACASLAFAFQIYADFAGYSLVTR